MDNKAREFDRSIRTLLVLNARRDYEKFTADLRSVPSAVGIDPSDPNLNHDSVEVDNETIGRIKLYDEAIETVSNIIVCSASFEEMRKLLKANILGKNHSLANLCHCVIIQMGYIEQSFQISL
jgi:hypothetical protein